MSELLVEPAESYQTAVAAFNFILVSDVCICSSNEVRYLIKTWELELKIISHNETLF